MSNTLHNFRFYIVFNILLFLILVLYFFIIEYSAFSEILAHYTSPNYSYVYRVEVALT